MRSKAVVFAMAFVLLVAGTAFADAGGFTGALKVGWDLAGRWNPDVWGDYKTDDGLTIAAEGYYKIHDYVDLGAGAQYMAQRKIHESPDWKFWFAPIYGAVRLHPAMTDYTPYGILQLGYAFHDGNTNYWNGLDTSGGLYWGGGAGFIFKRHFLAEVLYSECRGAGEVAPGMDYDLVYHKITLSLGYNF